MIVDFKTGEILEVGKKTKKLSVESDRVLTEYIGKLKNVCIIGNLPNDDLIITSSNMKIEEIVLWLEVGKREVMRQAFAGRFVGD